jgi:lipooligosaccharide transport system ATP-binding protein
MITGKNLVKSFGDFTAVNGVDFEVRPGECFGLLGPNGAGKSTIINMIYGVVRRTSGDLKVFGLDPSTEAQGIKDKLGVITQENALDESLTVRENMLLYASFMSVPKAQRDNRVDELLDYMNLAHKKDAEIKTLSGGMRRRLVFVRALLGQPQLIILDEPTTGLDPAVRHLLWGKVKELKSKGATILLTTHYMHEAEILCDRVVILNRGKVVTEGSPRTLIETHTPGYVGVFPDEPAVEANINAALLESPGHTMSKHSSGIHLRSPSFEEFSNLQNTHKLAPLQIRPANLEDVFLACTGEELEADD